MLQSNLACDLEWSRVRELQLMKPGMTTTEARSTLEPVLDNKRNHCNEKPMHHNQTVALRSLQLDKSLCSKEDPAQATANR